MTHQIRFVWTASMVNSRLPSFSVPSHRQRYAKEVPIETNIGKHRKHFVVRNLRYKSTAIFMESIFNVHLFS